MVWHYGGADRRQDSKKLAATTTSAAPCPPAPSTTACCYVAELDGILHCLDAKTGKVYWEHDTEPQIWSSPYWADGKVTSAPTTATCSSSQHGKKKKLLAENDMDGRVRATPVAANGVLYVMTENKLYAIASKK